jgi:hypothetical protein
MVSDLDKLDRPVRLDHPVPLDQPVRLDHPVPATRGLDGLDHPGMAGASAITRCAGGA